MLSENGCVFLVLFLVSRWGKIIPKYFFVKSGGELMLKFFFLLIFLSSSSWSYSPHFLEVDKIFSEVDRSLTFPFCSNLHPNATEPVECQIPTNIPLFQSEEVLKLKLKSEFFDPKINPKKPKNKTKLYDGDLSIMGEIDKKIPVKISVRGGYRSVLCDEKPLKIELPKEFDKTGTLFQRADNEFKIVRGCQSKDPENQKKVLREYQQYKLLECMGLPHLKVRLFESEFLSSEGLIKNKSYGFFIESPKDAGQRCGKDSLVLTKEEASKQNLPGSLNARFLLGLSENILGNTDYTQIGDHNSKKIISKDQRDILIPYDFDLSALTELKGKVENLMISEIESFGHSKDFIKNVACPQYNKILKTQETCENSIEKGPLVGEDREFFFKWMERVYSEITQGVKTLCPQ